MSDDQTDWRPQPPRRYMVLGWLSALTVAGLLVAAVLGVLAWLG